MKKTHVMLVVALLFFPFFVNQAVSQDEVDISIKGGFRIKITIHNSLPDIVKVKYEVNLNGLLKEINGVGEKYLDANETFYYISDVPFFGLINIEVEVVGHQTIIKKGISLFHIAVLFEG
jgi:hypothetical protein